MNIIGVLVIGVLAVTFTIPSSWAHTTVTIPPYDIEVGWDLEPPVVGVRNAFVFHVTEPGESAGVKTGIINAFHSLTATANYGGITKVLEINSDQRPGFYFSDVIPTKTGTISVTLEGVINDVPVNVDVPIEDIESTALLDFPPRDSSSDQNVQALEAAMISMQSEIEQLRSGSDPVTDTTSYNFAVLGLSLGVSAVVLSVLALIRRPSA